ncbi:hypothetical protein ACU686_32435 [Yinghuangia aomiensis]
MIAPLVVLGLFKPPWRSSSSRCCPEAAPRPTECTVPDASGASDTLSF